MKEFDLADRSIGVGRYREQVILAGELYVELLVQLLKIQLAER